MLLLLATLGSVTLSLVQCKVGNVTLIDDARETIHNGKSSGAGRILGGEVVNPPHSSPW